MWQPGWQLSFGENSIYMTESLCCSLETITTLLIAYTTIQNKNVEGRKRMDQQNTRIKHKCLIR